MNDYKIRPQNATRALSICFPIIWVSLDRRGNFNTQERITLMERFIKIFGIEIILVLLSVVRENKLWNVNYPSAEDRGA